MTGEQSDLQPEKKKYRYTKQLIRIALDNGYTNKDIATKAGLSEKSIAQVSRWRNGEAQATERQMRALINEFGHHLKRRMEHLFWFEEEGKQNFFILEGDILLKHTLRIPVKTGKFDKTANVGIHRILLIENQNTFILVFQDRAGLKETVTADNIKALAHSDNEEANWWTQSIRTSNTSLLVLNEIDELVKSLKLYEKPTLLEARQNERRIVAYKARQALLRLGHPIEDLVDIDLSRYEIQDKATQ